MAQTKVVNMRRFHHTLTPTQINSDHLHLNTHGHLAATAPVLTLCNTTTTATLTINHKLIDLFNSGTTGNMILAFLRQTALLDDLRLVSASEIDRAEIAQKEHFRQRIQEICRLVITEHEWNISGNADFPPSSVELKCFGSLSSGFATKASDMDLGLLSPLSKYQPDAPGSPIPRLIEKAFLDAGIGARLLSRTRVPIIKLCESPPESLLKDLVAQREKWEAGLDQDQPEFHGEDEQTGVEAKDEQSTQQLEQDRKCLDLTTFQVPDEQGQFHEFHLRQTPRQSLASYSALAKRVLHKAGGREVNLSNIREFSSRYWTILNLVCRSFVHGLADTSLRQRLVKYPSLAFEPNSEFPHNRSLLGVSVQVEGEQLIQMWEDWPVSATLAALDPSVEQYISFWHKLQSQPNSGQNPISYTKELQVALERLKKLPPFQLLLLEQGPEESVTQYYQRALVIIKHLGIENVDHTYRAHPEAIHKYIAGICRDDVRNDVKSWQSSTDIWDLDHIVSKHRIIQLTKELERALEKKLYGDREADFARHYMDILQMPLEEDLHPAGTRTFIIPLRDDNPERFLRMAEEVLHLDKLALNQPRDRYRDPLEFPEMGAGVQCDINFSAHLALENTLLLRCYAFTDTRVRPMVLFIKHWAKLRGINSGYRGTLSSYGYVLMVLHYLVNVASPFVCPNLQQLGRSGVPQMCKGYNVSFWRDEVAIQQLAASLQMNQNTQSIGYLLRGFFEYFAQNGNLSTANRRGFDWGRDVLSLRTPGGLVTKQVKGWTGAKTVYQAQDPKEPSVKPPAHLPDGPSGEADQANSANSAAKSTAVKEIRLRYLFAIEDPFEIEHNVARTVTHNGIVSIREEFRRAWRIIQAAGQGLPRDDLLLAVDQARAAHKPSQCLYEIHGRTVDEP
ncbi:Poly(A) RNA polymerase cid13 [Beauveria brongniartii RCEF 3172]|uniref:polynucleotide adenylyltransferase n=1 Tax=Beauveria brongniartii RCEF 3172 TaxID=1081107 RepID=A0A167K0X7_9HYPO|nr:Poly(A) RNA polymerase cid13 [Beauveria brongniartii RCEF 3172]